MEIASGGCGWLWRFVIGKCRKGFVILVEEENRTYPFEYARMGSCGAGCIWSI